MVGNCSLKFEKFLTLCFSYRELDAGLLRRLEKRILVGLPNAQAREALIRNYLPEIVLRQPMLRSNISYAAVAKVTYWGTVPLVIFQFSYSLLFQLYFTGYSRLFRF